MTFPGSPLYKAGEPSAIGASTAGAVLKVLIIGKNVEAVGTWAVTAPEPIS
jgi:hypothetical protein